VTGAIDETGQEKAGEATAGVKRQYLGCAVRAIGAGQARRLIPTHLPATKDR
jgi:SRSO17 transposase